MKSGDVSLISGSLKPPTAVGGFTRALVVAGLVVAALSACTAARQPAPATTPTTTLATAPPTAPATTPTTARTSSSVLVKAPIETIAAFAPEVVVNASDLPESALSDELAFWDDPASPGGKMIGIPNTGDELDPPPENDPAVTFQVEVQQAIPYRCWIHMKVGAPMGKSQANVIWAQFSSAVDKKNQEILRPGSGSYLTAQGPEQEGWTWVACDPPDDSSAPLVYYRKGGPVTVRLQAGMEGVGFDQFLLSPARFLEKAPSEAIVAK
jgi:hypothetical protein